MAIIQEVLSSLTCLVYGTKPLHFQVNLAAKLQPQFKVLLSLGRLSFSGLDQYIDRISIKYMAQISEDEGDLKSM